MRYKTPAHMRFHLYFKQPDIPYTSVPYTYIYTTFTPFT